MASIQTCPICHDSAWLPAAFNLFKCAGCSLVVGPQLWRLGDLANANDEAFGNDFVDKVDRWQALFETIRNRRVWRRIRRWAAPGRSLLEVGVGSGSLLAHAKSEGLDVLGCDLSPAVCDYVKRRHNLEVVRGDVLAIPETSRFDIVVMTHVLEHVADPVGTLAYLRGMMRPSAVLYLAVPNAGCWEARLPGWVGYQPYHLSYFTNDSVMRVLRAGGFTLLNTETVETFSGWSLAATRSLRGGPASETPRFRSAEGRGAGRHVQCALVAGIGVLTAPVRCIQSRLGFGEELIAIAVPAHVSTTLRKPSIQRSRSSTPTAQHGSRPSA